MNIVHYEARDPHVGTIECTSCQHLTLAWQSSGMSESYPHFYCDTCSNVFHRESDRELVHAGHSTLATLTTIAKTLPRCPCGGHFRPGANPKCPSCGAEFVHSWDPAARLTLPEMLVLDGAVVVQEGDRSYQVCIDREPK